MKFDDRSKEWGDEDRHKAPASTPPRPLSLQDWVIPSFGWTSSSGEGKRDFCEVPARSGKGTASPCCKPPRLACPLPERAVSQISAYGTSDDANGSLLVIP